MRQTTAEQPTKARGLRCPDCGRRDWEVRRTTPAADAVRRTRTCKGCGRKLITYERPAGE